MGHKTVSLTLGVRCVALVSKLHLNVYIDFVIGVSSYCTRADELFLFSKLLIIGIVCPLHPSPAS